MTKGIDMRNKRYRGALLAALVLGGATVSAADTTTDLAPTTARVVRLGTISTLTYYTVEQDGFRVVTTIQPADASESGAAMTPVRFIVTLAPGEAARISVPRDSGSAIELRIARVGDLIEVSRSDDRPVDDRTASQR
jgi:hypothetical protein